MSENDKIQQLIDLVKMLIEQNTEILNALIIATQEEDLEEENEKDDSLD